MVSGIFRCTEFLRLCSIALGASALVVMALPFGGATPAEAKTPGSKYCYFGVCHRVKTIEETRSLVGRQVSIVASHYDHCKRDRFNPCGLTSSGERFYPDRPDNTASPIYPDGTTLLVWNPETKRALVVRVNNAGPYHGNRKLDLSVAAAEKLGFKGQGVAKLKVKVVKAPEPKEAKYSKHRRYAKVPGDIGEYSSVEEAEKGMAVAFALQASATSLLAPITARVFSAHENEYLVADVHEIRRNTPTRLATLGVQGRERVTAVKAEGSNAVGKIRPKPVTDNEASSAPKAALVKAAPGKKKRSARSKSRRKKVASRRPRRRAKGANRRLDRERAKRVRTVAVRKKEPRRYKFHANSISDSHHRHMGGASKG